MTHASDVKMKLPAGVDPPKRLMLCAGSTRRPGWRTLDSNRQHDPTYLATLPPLPDAVSKVRWDEIELIHGITSFYPWDAKRLLHDIRLILALGGKLVLEQPDLDIVLGHVMTGGSLAWLFGDPAFSQPAHMNRWAYSPDSLTDLLYEVGFSRVEHLPAQHHNPARDFRLEAYR